MLLGLIVAGTGTKVFANNNSDTYEYFFHFQETILFIRILEEKMIQRPLGVNVLMPAVTNQNFMSQYMEQVNITTHRAVIVDVGHMYLEKKKNGICGIRFMKHMEMTHIQRHI